MNKYQHLRIIQTRAQFALEWVVFPVQKLIIFLKMGQLRPLFCLFSVFSNKHYKFYNKYV